MNVNLNCCCSKKCMSSSKACKMPHCSTTYTLVCYRQCSALVIKTLGKKKKLMGVHSRYSMTYTYTSVCDYIQYMYGSIPR